MNECHKDYFHEKGLKNTPMRDRVYHVLVNKALTAEDVFETLRKDNPNIVFSTVYRTLEQFSETGITERIFLDNENKTRYQIKDEHIGHAHQLICTNCHQVIALKTCPVESITTEIQASNKFMIQYHQLRFYGLCQDCQA
jgi:Fur family ferric uptake transcriptional regulator